MFEQTLGPEFVSKKPSLGRRGRPDVLISPLKRKKRKSLKTLTKIKKIAR